MKFTLIKLLNQSTNLNSLGHDKTAPEAQRGKDEIRPLFPRGNHGDFLFAAKILSNHFYPLPLDTEAQARAPDDHYLGMA